MSKLILYLGAIVALTAILVIPSAFTPTSTQVAKASSCSVQAGQETQHVVKTLGSCSTAGGQSAHFGPAIEKKHDEGSKSTCKAVSISQSTFDASHGDSNIGSVSCSLPFRPSNGQPSP